jgi:predicted PurR-regulated permease PerM
VVLVSVLFGSTLFGVLGALLAIPIAAAIEISIVEYSKLRRAENIVAVHVPTLPDKPGAAG